MPWGVMRQAWLVLEVQGMAAACLDPCLAESGLAVGEVRKS